MAILTPPSKKVKPSDIWRLDKGDFAKIAKRVGRSESTVRRWKRDGIPKTARTDAKGAVNRHLRAIAVGKVRSIAVRKVREKLVAPTVKIRPKAARKVREKLVAPTVKVRSIAVRKVREKLVAPTVKVRPKAAVRIKGAFEEVSEFFEEFKLPPEPTTVPLTAQERLENVAQRKILAAMASEIKTKLNDRKMYTIALTLRNGLEGINNLDGRDLADRRILRLMIRLNDPRWLEYKEFLEVELGLNDERIRTSWFSPSVIYFIPRNLPNTG
jgi:transposase